MQCDDVLVAVRAELEQVIAKRRPFASAHEAYGVLKEEVDEFFDEVRARDDTDDERKRRAARIRQELIQVATVAIRAAAEVGGHGEGELTR